MRCFVAFFKTAFCQAFLILKAVLFSMVVVRGAGAGRRNWVRFVPAFWFGSYGKKSLRNSHPNVRAELRPSLARRLNARLNAFRASGRRPKFFDELLIGVLGEEVPHLFSKVDIMDETYAELPRPEFYKVDTVHDSIFTFPQYLEGLLERWHSFYLKGEQTVGGGKNIMRLDFDGRKVVLTIPNSELRKEIAHNLGLLLGKDNFLQNFPGQSEREIAIPLENRRGPVVFWKQPLAEIAKTLANHVIPKGRYIMEKPLNIPLINGRTWEIRHLVHCDRLYRPVITAKYGKIGGDAYFGNMDLGGRPVLAEKPVHDVLQNSQKEREFLARSEGIALAGAKLLNAHLLSSLTSYINARMTGITPDNFFARRLAVDITGHLGRNGKLFPAVIEIQYPIGFKSYVPELEEVDKQALARVQAMDKALEKQDLPLIQQMLNG